MEVLDGLAIELMQQTDCLLDFLLKLGEGLLEKKSLVLF